MIGYEALAMEWSWPSLVSCVMLLVILLEGWASLVGSLSLKASSEFLVIFSLAFTSLFGWELLGYIWDWMSSHCSLLFITLMFTPLPNYKIIIYIYFTHETKFLKFTIQINFIIQSFIYFKIFNVFLIHMRTT